MGSTVRVAAVSVVGGLAVVVGACSGGSSHRAVVPTVGSVAAATGGGQASRAAALHAAAECIRQHGIPNMKDPTVSPDGSVYTDTRAIEDAAHTKDDTGAHQTGTLEAVRSACTNLISAADWNPEQLPPAPPAMVAAGVRAAQCLRAHGLPNVKDPTPATAYVPDHGFSMSADEVPAGGKGDPAMQSALAACRPALDGEIQASSLTNLPKR